MTISISVSNGKVRAISPYNPSLPAQARELGGKWTGSEWVFDARDEQRVRDLYISVYGTDGTNTGDLVTIRVTVLHSGNRDKSALFLAGRQIARAFGRDTGAKLGDGVVVLEGSGFDSGGSRANWTTKFYKGTVFEVRDVPKKAVEDEQKSQTEYSSDPYFKIEIVEHETPENSASVDVSELQAERENLVNRIAEIDEILKKEEQESLKISELTFQHQLSNGNWADVDNDRRAEFLDMCVKYNEGIESHEDAVKFMSAGKKLRNDYEDWYSNCRMFDKAAHDKKIAEFRKQEEEREKSYLTCRSCGQTGPTGQYPFSTLPDSGLCDDCV